ncbi:G-type lectin S-receptor-like serine/threonine-protein kinase At4g27290 isoform X2 [Rutidosis leptorrhynchoides]|uniref:G-type lectin S-receptor-like serine/threonine-protein kinase At4g27290 isoform X2 n=1 Tax=Rutidosis leptorrhynchoides TaxID=125765 RepID=UPI003A9905E1
MEGAFMFLFSVLVIFIQKINTIELDIISNSKFLTEGDTLVSETRIFELGFFRPDKSENRYIGIWYKQISVRTVVWVANRNHPLPRVSPLVLKIVDPGIFCIFNNNNIIWSSNTTMTSPNATAKLHDTGNLVLMDEQEKMMWQSFDYPTDTILYHMKMGIDYSRGIEWRLTSWRSSQDPSPGEFTWEVDTHGYPENKLKQGAVVNFRGVPWRNYQVTGYIFSLNMTLIYNVVINENEMSREFYIENSSIISRFTLNSSGELQYWAWPEEGNKWKLGIKFPVDICDTYNMCGSYGTCSFDTRQQSCACLDKEKFVPRNQKGWEMADWSDGCVRRTPLDCINGSDGFIKYSKFKLPDTEGTWFNMSMPMDECEAKCLKNCTCMAYALPDDTLGGKGCVHWFSDLIDMRESPENARDIFIRMASSELASKKKDGANIKVILSAILTGVLLICFISMWYVRKKKNNEQSIKGGNEDLQLFSFTTIATATASFSTENILGQGGFGAVYKGVLEDGLEIAVKRLCTTSNQGIEEFKNEVICISRLQHRNLVKLLGCCIKGDEKLLIYEYMPNKSLDSFIFGENQTVHLDWPKRFDIIKGIARGLVYLHQDSRLRIIHRDLKAGNILLDQDMNPKISDFGLARSFGGNETQGNTQRVVGTYGYMSPEYVINGTFSIKSDVFSFGVLVLEIVSGKKNRGFNHPEHGNNLTGHAWSVYSEGRSIELMNPCLAESCHPNEVIRSVAVGLLCVQKNAEDRPNMSSVVRMLDGEGAVPLPTPKQPAFFIGRDLLDADLSSSSTNPAGSINGLSITQLDAR